MKKSVPYFLILNLVLSIIAFSFILNINFISADIFDEWTDPEGIVWTQKIEGGQWVGSNGGKLSDAFMKKGREGLKNLAGTTTTGIPTASHGLAGKLIEKIFGPGSTAPQGSEFVVNGKDITASGFGFSASGIVQGAWWALIAYQMTTMIAPMFGLDESQTNAIASAIGWGVFSGTSAYSIFGEGGIAGTHMTSTFWGATGIGIGVAVVVFYMTYKEEYQETITFSCNPWDAPVGGNHCEKCNKQALPCSEYQCRSLGQACELLNPGTDDEKCAWVNKNDVNPPIIKPFENALLEDYNYRIQNTGISPPDTGVVVEYSKSADKCIPAFTPLSFGITLDEPAKCKVDYLRKDTFDELEFYFGGSSLLKYNHTQVLSLPGPNVSETDLIVENNGRFDLYTRCQDANGNYNTANFVFKFCVDSGPDTTPPMIVTTSLLNNMPIAFGQTSVDLEVYVNEPAECRWDQLDKSYEDMLNEMSCASSIMEMNAQMLYKCSTTLTGLKDRESNKFYFRCKDKPLATDRNVNTESYEFVLLGTQPLIIDSVKPDGIIKDSTDVVKVTLEAKTSAGYNEGKAICSYKNTETQDGDNFYNTNSFIHTQDLWLSEGEYEYLVRCVDLGGNSDNKTTNFSVETDTDSPIVVRAYHEETYLKLITNEPAECVYDSTDCSYPFDEGIKMTSIGDTNHFTDWKTDKDFYVKCQDTYGNRPNPNECSIIVRPFKTYEV